jgi:hypothetical protein
MFLKRKSAAIIDVDSDEESEEASRKSGPARTGKSSKAASKDKVVVAAPSTLKVPSARMANVTAGTESEGTSSRTRTTVEGASEEGTDQPSGPPRPKARFKPLKDDGECPLMMTLWSSRWSGNIWNTAMLRDCLQRHLAPGDVANGL